MGHQFKPLPFGVREVPTTRRWTTVDIDTLTISPDGRLGVLAQNADNERVVVVPVLVAA